MKEHTRKQVKQSIKRDGIWKGIVVITPIGPIHVVRSIQRKQVTFESVAQLNNLVGNVRFYQE